MQKFLSKYAVAAHLALLAVSPLFLFPFFEPGVVAEVVLWLALFALAWVFMEPSRHADEMLHDARSRVAASVVRDPLFWVMGVMVLLAALRWINSGVELAFDTENMRWHLTDPLFAALPSAAAGRGKFEFSVTLAAWIILIGIRHSLGRQARLSFLLSSAVLAGVAAIVSVSLSAVGDVTALSEAKALFDSKAISIGGRMVVKEPAFVGAVFALYALASVVALAGAIEAKWKRTGWLVALAIGGTFAGAFTFAPAVSVLLYGGTVLLTAFICMGWLGSVSRGVNAMRFFAILFISVALATVVVTCVAPDEIVESRVAEIKSLSLFPQNFPEVRAVLAKVSFKIWDEAKWLGCGLGTFASQMRFAMEKPDWSIVVYARPGAFSAWWTLLAERGLIGAITLSVPLAFLFFTFFRRIPGFFRGRVFLPGCWLGFAALAVAVTESFYDVSFLRPEAMLAVAAFIAIASGSLPPPKKSSSSRNGEDGD